MFAKFSSWFERDHWSGQEFGAFCESAKTKFPPNTYNSPFVYCITNVNQCIVVFIPHTHTKRIQNESDSARFLIEHCKRQWMHVCVCACSWLYTYGWFCFRQFIPLCMIFWRFPEWMMALMNAPCWVKISYLVPFVERTSTELFGRRILSSVCEWDQVIAVVIVLASLIFRCVAALVVAISRFVFLKVFFFRLMHEPHALLL